MTVKPKPNGPDPFAGVQQGQDPNAYPTNMVFDPRRGFQEMGWSAPVPNQVGRSQTFGGQTFQFAQPEYPGGPISDSFVPGAPTGQAQGGTALGQLTDAAKVDMAAADKAKTENEARGDVATKGMQALLGRAGGEIDARAAANTGKLDAAGKAATDLSQGQVDAFGNYMKGAQDDTNADVKGVLGGLNTVDREAGQVTSDMSNVQGGIQSNVIGGVDSVTKYGDQAIAEARANKQQALDLRASNIAAATVGLKAKLRNMNASLAGMTPEQAEYAKGQMRSEINDQQTQVVAHFNDQWNDMNERLGNTVVSAIMKAGDLGMEGLKTKLAGYQTQLEAGKVKLGATQVKQESSRLRLSGAQTMAETRLELGRQMLTSQAGQRQMQELSAGLAQASATLDMGAETTKLSFESQGLTALAAMMDANKRGIVSRFGPLVELLKVATAPGGRNVPGIDLTSANARA